MTRTTKHDALLNGLIIWVLMLTMILHNTRYALAPFTRVQLVLNATEDTYVKANNNNKNNNKHVPKKEKKEDQDQAPHSTTLTSGVVSTATPLKLSELTRAYEPVTCQDGLYPVSSIVNETAEAAERIPKIVHLTGKSKCVTQAFKDNVLAWQLEGYAFYFHDDGAVEALLQQHWPMFPHIHNAYRCLQNAGGAAKADLWRYLALWQYGGVYADMDTRPSTRFHGKTIAPDTDGFFLIEGQFRILSQWFFAVAPKHPMMFLAIQDVLQRMHTLPDVGKLDLPVESGPHSLHRAFETFQGIHNPNQKSKLWNKSNLPQGESTVYRWKGANPNRTITVVGTHQTSEEWVTRVTLSKQQKNKDWKAMNVTNYRTLKKQQTNKTCLDLLWETYQPEM